MTVNTVTIVASAALIVCLLAAAVALALAGWDTSAIVGLLTAVAGIAAILLPLLDKAINLMRETAQQTETLAVITKQTNGELDRRINDGAAKAAEEALRRFMDQPTGVYPTVTIPPLRTDEPALP